MFKNFIDIFVYMYVLNVLTVILMFDESINRYELTWPGQKLKLTPEGGVVGPQ